MAFSRMDVTLKLGNYRSDYVLLLTDAHDIYASYYEQTADEKVRGEAVLLGGQVLIVKADVVDGIRDLRAIDIPLSVGELATVLLGAAIPDGPSTITGPRTIKAADRERFVLAPTSTGGSLYGPPWQMSGKVRRTSATAVASTSSSLSARPMPRATCRRARRSRCSSSAPPTIGRSATTFPDSFNLSG